VRRQRTKEAGRYYEGERDVSRTHELKCWPEPFQAILDGRRRFEFRRDDRGYAVGDILDLREWDPHTRYYRRHENDGHTVYRAERQRVTYILRGLHGVPEGFVVMSIEPEEPPPARNAGSGTP
jgi:hypothetical protein